jgi:hypothetical protein
MGTMTTRIGEVVVAAWEASNKVNVLHHSQSPGPKSHLAGNALILIHNAAVTVVQE